MSKNSVLMLINCTQEALLNIFKLWNNATDIPFIITLVPEVKFNLVQYDCMLYYFQTLLTIYQIG